jgi:hypothetical protein
MRRVTRDRERERETERETERERDRERETDLVDHDDVKHRPVAGWGSGIV